MSAKSLDSGEVVQVEHGMSVLTGYRIPSTFFGDHATRRERMYGKNGQLVALGKCLRSGMGIRASAKKVGCSTDRASKLHAHMRAAGVVLLCACGKHSAHHGGCSARNPTRAAASPYQEYRRGIVRRASARWYAKLTPEAKQRIYDRQTKARGAA